MALYSVLCVRHSWMSEARSDRDDEFCRLVSGDIRYFHSLESLRCDFAWPHDEEVDPAHLPPFVPAAG